MSKFSFFNSLPYGLVNFLFLFVSKLASGWIILAPVAVAIFLTNFGAGITSVLIMIGFPIDVMSLNNVSWEVCFEEFNFNKLPSRSKRA